MGAELLGCPLPAPQAQQEVEAAKLAAAAAEAQAPRTLTQEEQAQRLLHLHAKDLIMKLYAQSQYVKTRTRLQRVRGAATVRCRQLMLYSLQLCVAEAVI